VFALWIFYVYNRSLVLYLSLFNHLTGFKVFKLISRGLHVEECTAMSALLWLKFLFQYPFPREEGPIVAQENIFLQI